jgi:hypothetical protein
MLEHKALIKDSRNVLYFVRLPRFIHSAEVDLTKMMEIFNLSQSLLGKERGSINEVLMA